MGYDLQYEFAGTNLMTARLTVSDTLLGKYSGPTYTHNFVANGSGATIIHVQSTSNKVGSDSPGYLISAQVYIGPYSIGVALLEDVVQQLLNTQVMLLTNLEGKSFSVRGFSGPYYELPPVGGGNVCRPDNDTFCGGEPLTVYSFSLSVKGNDAS